MNHTHESAAALSTAGDDLKAAAGTLPSSASPVSSEDIVHEVGEAWGIGNRLPIIGSPQRTVSNWRPASHTDSVPDTAVDLFSIGEFEVRAASVRGRSHRYYGQVRQDSFAIGANEQWIAAVVCDGLGSKARSHIGARASAETAVATALSVAPDADVRSTLSRGLDAAVRGIETLCRCGGPECLDAFSCTFTMALISVQDGTAHIAVVGDSPALLVTGGRVREIESSDGIAADGALTDSATDCLPRGAHRVRFLSSEVRTDQTLILCSDGFGHPAVSTDGSKYFGKAWNSAPDSIALLQDLNFIAKSYDDDRTAVGVWRRAAVR